MISSIHSKDSTTERTSETNDRSKKAKSFHWHVFELRYESEREHASKRDKAFETMI